MRRGLLGLVAVFCCGVGGAAYGLDICSSPVSAPRNDAAEALETSVSVPELDLKAIGGFAPVRQPWGPEPSSLPARSSFSVPPPSFNPEPAQGARLERQTGFRWKAATADSFRFLMLQHAARFVFQAKTRRGLAGPFFRDYLETLRTAPDGFMDGDDFLTNFIGHPIQGATTYHLARVNGANKRQAFWWGVAYSTHFEAGPLGETSIGNVVVSPVDLVVTPILGHYLGITEEWLQQRIDRIERPALRKLSRLILVGRLLARVSSGK